MLGGALAAIVSGTTGFGFAVVATALWSQLAEPQRVTTLTLVLQLALNVVYLPFLWRDISLRRLAPFALGSLVGVPAGAWALSAWPVAPLRLALGLALMSWSLWMLSRAVPPTLRLSGMAARAADAGIGVVGGFLGGIAGLSGVLPALWVALRAEGDARSNRGVVQGYILFTSVLGVAWVGRVVGIDTATRDQVLLSLPFVIAGGLLGLKVFSKLDTRRFSQAVLIAVALCGTLLAVDAFSALGLWGG